MAWIEHEKALLCEQLKINGQNPTKKRENSKSFLEAWRLLHLHCVEEMTFPLEKEDEVNEWENDDKGCMYLKWYFSVAFKSSILENVGLNNATDHVFMEMILEGCVHE